MRQEQHPQDPDGALEELRTDCARMAPHWSWQAPATRMRVPAARIHSLGRITVSPASAALLTGMSEYGD